MVQCYVTAQRIAMDVILWSIVSCSLSYHALCVVIVCNTCITTTKLYVEYRQWYQCIGYYTLPIVIVFIFAVACTFIGSMAELTGDQVCSIGQSYRSSPS